MNQSNDGKPPDPEHPILAYRNKAFLDSSDARSLRIMSEYLYPLSHFRKEKIQDTIVFFGSARTFEMGPNGKYYDDARELARQITLWSDNLPTESRRFVVCSGGGPGIMEAANRGASEAKGLNVGLTISIPNEEFDNPYVSRELDFHFHYFFMRKFWFVYLAKAVVLFPGGFGTLDEMFEILTLVQTRKMKRRLPIVLFGAKFWNEVVNFDALVRYGTISPEDVNLFHRTDSVDEAFDILTKSLIENALPVPGATL
jgi:uncharacterized protein (TIGR00730 family)